jgi:hypothetical protein
MSETRLAWGTVNDWGGVKACKVVTMLNSVTTARRKLPNAIWHKLGEEVSREGVKEGKEGVRAVEGVHGKGKNILVEPRFNIPLKTTKKDIRNNCEECEQVRQCAKSTSK